VGFYDGFWVVALGFRVVTSPVELIVNQSILAVGGAHHHGYTAVSQVRRLSMVGFVCCEEWLVQPMAKRRRQEARSPDEILFRWYFIPRLCPRLRFSQLEVSKS
jgi:hypothetical protein